MTSAIEEIPGPQPVIYRQCIRCGMDVRPSTHRQQCGDCKYVQESERAATLRDRGVPDKKIADILGIHHKTILRALGPRAEWGGQ